MSQLSITLPTSQRFHWLDRDTLFGEKEGTKSRWSGPCPGWPLWGPEEIVAKASLDWVAHVISWQDDIANLHLFSRESLCQLSHIKGMSQRNPYRSVLSSMFKNCTVQNFVSDSKWQNPTVVPFTSKQFGWCPWHMVVPYSSRRRTTIPKNCILPTRNQSRACVHNTHEKFLTVPATM